MEDYILRTAAISPLFAHQIIWNMKANFYRDDMELIVNPLIREFYLNRMMP